MERPGNARRQKSDTGPKAAPKTGKARAEPVDSDPARVELGHLDRVLGYALRRAQIAVFNDFRKTFAEFEIRPTQYAVLSIIADQPGLRQGEVSKALGIKRTNFVAVLDELERRGLAERRPMANDRRSRALHLTATGAAVTERIRKINAVNEARLAGLLPPGEAALLIDLLRRLTDAIGGAEETE